MQESLFYLQKTFRLVLLFVIFIIGVRTFLIEPGIVNGRSMENTYKDNAFFFVNKLTYLFNEPKRGDVVQAKLTQSDSVLIKRVIALPGERVRIRAGVVEISQGKGEFRLLQEPYLKKQKNTFVENQDIYQTVVLPSHTYFLMGDNRTMSSDSRDYGPVHRTNIFGKILRK